MDTARYVVAVLALVSVPPAIVYWLVIHPFVGFWRRRGLRVTYGFVAAVFLGVLAGLFLARDAILRDLEFGTHWSLWVLAVALYGLSIAVELRCRKWLSLRILVGLPELERDRGGRRLLREGIYARMRHPRYVSFALGFLALALFANYLAVYLLLFASMVALYVVARFEERELVDAFGAEYEAYRREVPMFLPKRGPAGP